MDIKSLKHSMAAFAAGMIAVTLFSCGENGSSAGTDASYSELDKSAGSVGNVASKAKESTGGVLASIGEQFSSQLDQHQDKVNALKEKAKSIGDQHLNSILSGLDNQIAKARDELAKIMNDEGGSVDALKQRIQPLIDEITKMYDHANSHIS